jgi:hypothetical protein
MRHIYYLLFLAGCSVSPLLEGQVVDVWGNPIPEASVIIQENRLGPDGKSPQGKAIETHIYSGKSGYFSLPLHPGTAKIKAGIDGYIQSHLSVEIPEAGPTDPIRISLYPKPSSPGFYAVGSSAYAALNPETVKQVGTSLQTIRGISSAGDVILEDYDLKVIFHTELRLDDVMRLGLELCQLQFQNQAQISGPLSATTVNVNMWSSAGTIPIDITPLRSRNEYLIQAKAPLTPGAYAFQTQGLLGTQNATQFNQIPEELRTVFPFELR